MSGAADLRQDCHCPSATQLTLENRVFRCALGCDLSCNTSPNAQHTHTHGYTLTPTLLSLAVIVWVVQRKREAEKEQSSIYLRGVGNLRRASVVFPIKVTAM